MKEIGKIMVDSIYSHKLIMIWGENMDSVKGISWKMAAIYTDK